MISNVSGLSVEYRTPALSAAQIRQISLATNACQTAILMAQGVSHVLGCPVTNQPHVSKEYPMHILVVNPMSHMPADLQTP